MKLRNKIMFITMLAMIAFIGIGFAAWTFTAERAVDDISITDKVAVAVELNDNFALYNADDDSEITALYLICDAPTAAVAGRYLAGSGVYWSSEADGSNVVTNVYIKGTLNYNVEDNVKPISKVVVTFTAGAFSVTSDYVNFGALTAPAAIEVTVANNADVQSADFALPTVAYTATALAIADVAGVTAMNTALGTSLSGKVISLSAQITSVIA